jgi:phage terminase large subunit-like protein
VTGSKELNADQFATKAKGGRVRLVRGAWNDTYLDELAAFPKGTYKDKADASGSAFNNLRQIVEQLKAEQQEDELVYEERVSISPV